MTNADCRRYIIAVISINDIGEGKVLPSTGQARFKTNYVAVVMKPFKGEVVDAKVVNVNKVSQISSDRATAGRRSDSFLRWVSSPW